MTDDLETTTAQQFGQDTPRDPSWPIVNATTVSPHAPTVEPGKVQIHFGLLMVLVLLSAMDVSLLFGFFVIR